MHGNAAAIIGLGGTISHDRIVGNHRRSAVDVYSAPVVGCVPGDQIASDSRRTRVDRDACPEVLSNRVVGYRRRRTVTNNTAVVSGDIIAIYGWRRTVRAVDAHPWIIGDGVLSNL